MECNIKYKTVCFMIWLYHHRYGCSEEILTITAMLSINNAIFYRPKVAFLCIYAGPCVCCIGGKECGTNVLWVVTVELPEMYQAYTVQRRLGYICCALCTDLHNGVILSSPYRTGWCLQTMHEPTSSDQVETTLPS